MKRLCFAVSPAGCLHESREFDVAWFKSGCVSLHTETSCALRFRLAKRPNHTGMARESYCVAMLIDKVL